MPLEPINLSLSFSLSLCGWIYHMFIWFISIYLSIFFFLYLTSFISTHFPIYRNIISVVSLWILFVWNRNFTPTLSCIKKKRFEKKTERDERERERERGSDEQRFGVVLAVEVVVLVSRGRTRLVETASQFRPVLSTGPKNLAITAPSPSDKYRGSAYFGGHN